MVEFKGDGRRDQAKAGAFDAQNAGAQPPVTDVVSSSNADRVPFLSRFRGRPRTETIQVPDTGMTVVKRPPIAITDMTEGVLPDDKVTEEVRTYTRIGQDKVHVLTVSSSTDSDPEYVVVGPPLTARKANTLLHAAAPNKNFGLDTGDVIGDGRAIDRPQNERLLKAHGTMPGWNHTQREKVKILELLERGRRVGGLRDNSRDTLTPVLRFTRGDGMKILLDPPSEEVVAALAASIPGEIDPEKLSSGLGLMHLAAFSPDHTEWPLKSGYHTTANGLVNSIGSTQILAYAHREVSKAQQDPNSVDPEADIQRSSLLVAFADYADGATPVLTIDGKTPKQLIKDRKDQERPAKKNARLRLASRGLLVAGGILLAAGGGTAFINGIRYSVADDDYSKIAPLDADVDAANATWSVLHNIEAHHPEVSPVLQPAMDEQVEVMQAYAAKKAEQETFQDGLASTIDTSLGAIGVGGVLLYTGVRGRKKYKY